MTERGIFTAALNKADPAERAAFLDEQCSGNAPLRQRIESLLAEHDQLGSFMDMPSSAATIDHPAERPGTQIGPYKLLQQIGEGGMGVVYMAEQSKPVERRVALKIIKPGMDTWQVIARFEAERQALAMMDHPNIAKVFEAGTTGGEPGGVSPGRPYFVMELVKGVPITRYCDEKHLSLQERLKLMIPVCQAIQHAHQKGIIHRDIKPTNVLVAQYDGRPVPKVIDFGVAKATAQKLTERTMFTELGQVVGTVEYMSPEQAELNQLDIDTRSDIYSLGVLLYELLTGTTPFDRQKLRSAAFHEMLRIIREDEPPKPSTSLSTSGTLASISANRQSDPVRLCKAVRGELDWIVMKALEKDRNRRYETANGLAADVQRYLNDEAVLACPPSASYRFRKLVGRNKGPVLAVTIVIATLVAGIVGTTWGMYWADDARRIAVAAQDAELQEKGKAVAAAAAEKKAKQAALAQAAETRALFDFVQKRILAAARPEGQDGGLGKKVTLREALEASLPYIDTTFRDQPRVEARLRNTLGLSFQKLGDSKIAAEQFEIASSLFTRHLGPDHPDTLATLDNLATSYRLLGRNADALKVHEKTLRLMKSKLGSEHQDTLGCMVNLANDYLAMGQPAEARKLFELALDVLNIKFPEHPFTLNCLTNLATSCDALDQPEEALKLREQALPLIQAQRGVDHPDTLLSMNNLAISYAAAGRHAEALKLNERTLALQQQKLGEDHPDTLASMNDLAVSYHDAGRHGDALNLDEKTLAMMIAKLGANHPDTLTSMKNLAADYTAVGRHAEAIQLYEKTLASRKVKLGVDHPDTIESMQDLAVTYHELGRHADGFKLDEETVAVLRAKWGAGHSDTLACLNSLAWQLSNCADQKFRNPVRAVELATEAVRLAPQEEDFWNTLGTAHYRNRDWPAAISALEKSAELSEGGGCLDWLFLAMAHGQLGDKAKARACFDRAVKWMEEEDSDDENLLRIRNEAAELLGIKHKPKQENKPSPKPRAG